MAITRPTSSTPGFDAPTVFAGVGTIWALLYGANVLGPLESLTFAILGVATFGAIVFGLRKFRPQPLWPWLVIVGALILFLIEGDVRLHLNTLGNLTAQRSLVPDLIAIPGYLLLAFGLTRLARGNDPDAGRNFDMVLDGLVASLAILTCAWAFMIDPVLGHNASPLKVRIVLACYPPLSVYLVYIAFRIGFKPGTRSTTASRFLVIAMICMLVGDTVYMLAELGKLHPSSTLINVPYLLAFVTFGAAVLHPTMATLSSSQAPRQEAPTRGRLTLVAAALGIPALVAVVNYQRSTTDRIAIAVIVVVLTITATLRIFRALHSSAKAQAELVYQVTHDTLTGLPNRAMVELFVNGALQSTDGSEARVALLFLDIDQFKFVNDTYGHSLGDELLIEVAERLRETARPKDLVARIGGDEFVVVLKDIRDLAHARQLAERIRVSFHAPFNVRESATYVFASVGVALAEGSVPMTSAETMIRDADNAMYQAKSSGRDAVAVFDASMRERVAVRHSLEQELQVALAHDELTVEYQPIMDLSAGRVTSLEALLRWTRSNGEEVPPTVFIPIAEESGLIIEIGRWVIGQACAQLEEWRSSVHGARDVRISVNVSSAQLRDPDLVPSVRRALREYNLPGNALELELTESLLMDNVPKAVSTLTELKQLGVQLSIDDFGTGYSSLAYLRRLPVDFVKIDRVFVEGLDRTDSSNATLVAAIIAMSHALGIVIVAEGVENAAQEERLRELGCDRVQGFLYSRPVEAAEVTATLHRLTGTGLRLVTRDAEAGRSAS